MVNWINLVNKTEFIKITPLTPNQTVTTTGTYSLNVGSLITYSTGLSGSDIRYYFYVYEFDNLNHVDNYICGTGGYIPSAIANCLLPTTTEGKTYKVVFVAYHWYYRLSDTVSYFIIPRTRHYIYPYSGLTFKLVTDSLSKFIFGFQYKFNISSSSTSFIPYTSGTGIHFTWGVVCYNLGTVLNSICSIDKYGNLQINNLSTFITSFVIYYANNICIYKGDVTPAHTCTDDIVTYVMNNPLQSVDISKNTSNSNSGLTVSSALFIPTFFNVLGNNYTPILYSTIWKMPTSMLSYTFSENINQSNNNVITTQSTTCGLKVNIVDTTATSFTNAFTTTNISIRSQSVGNIFSKLTSQSLQCNVDDRYENSKMGIRVFMDNYFIDYDLVVNFYSAGHIFVKNNRSLNLSCKYVNKFYILKVNNKISTRSDLNTIFGNSEANFWAGGAYQTLITDIKSHPSEIFDIIYVIDLNQSCTTDKMIINLNNLHMKQQNTNLSFSANNYDFNTKLEYDPLVVDTSTYTTMVYLF
jgi:hypothetical protein